MVIISRPAIITFAPQFKKNNDVVNPIPLEAPVTTIFLFRNSFCFGNSLFLRNYSYSFLFNLKIFKLLKFNLCLNIKNIY